MKKKIQKNSFNGFNFNQRNVSFVSNTRYEISIKTTKHVEDRILQLLICAKTKPTYFLGLTRFFALQRRVNEIMWFWLLPLYRYTLSFQRLFLKANTVYYLSKAQRIKIDTTKNKTSRAKNKPFKLDATLIRVFNEFFPSPLLFTIKVLVWKSIFLFITKRVQRLWLSVYRKNKLIKTKLKIWQKTWIQFENWIQKLEGVFCKFHWICIKRL